jgi:hypothetical protein
MEKMNFEVKGQAYFLNFVPDEGQWFLYTPTSTGIQRIPVTSDHHVGRFVLPPTADEEPKVM